ncbi:hypothetical protein [uncultured Mediterranean phage]|nr:hypothetical protein [uncultured Mediterranean phage]
MANEQTTGTGGDIATGTSAGTEGQGADASLHYETHEEADAAARKFQGEADKAKADLARYESLKALGTPEQINAFVTQMEPVTRLPGFDQFRAKGGIADNQPEADDEFLSDEQKEIRELRTQLDANTQSQNGEATRVNSELAELRFERAEKEMDAQFGELWREKRGAMLEKVRAMTASGAIGDPAAITPQVLMTAFLSSTTENPDEMRAFLTKAVQQWDGERTEHQNNLATSAPDTGRTAGDPVKDINSFQDAWEQGQRDLGNTNRR